MQDYEALPCGNQKWQWKMPTFIDDVSHLKCPFATEISPCLMTPEGTKTMTISRCPPRSANRSKPPPKRLSDCRGLHYPICWRFPQITIQYGKSWEIHPMIVIIAEWLTEKMEWYLPPKYPVQTNKCRCSIWKSSSRSLSQTYACRGPNGPKMRPITKYLWLHPCE